MSEMIVQRESLQRVGDKIKAKAGTTSEIVFPEGFEDTVDSISGGDTTAEDGLVTRTLTEYSNPRVTEVGKKAFYENERIGTLSFPNATKLGENAFQGCLKLTSIDAPKVTSVNNRTFYGCKKLQTVDFPHLTSVWSYLFYNCENLISCNIPLVETIGDNTFGSCYLLPFIDLPMVTTIKASAFAVNASLKAVVLRNTEVMCVLSNTNAFQNCYHFHGTVSATYNPDGKKDGYFYVPRKFLSDDDSTSDYRQATNWSTLSTQFRALEDFTVDGTTTGELDWDKIAAADAEVTE